MSVTLIMMIMTMMITMMMMVVMTMMMMMMINSIETEGCNHYLNGFLQLIVGPALNIHYTLYGREDVQ